MKCPKCNNEFKPVTKHNYTSKYCSKKCANSRKPTKASNDIRSQKMKVYHKKADHTKRIEKYVETCKINKQQRIINEEFGTLSVELKREQILYEQKSKCNICGLGEEWNNKKLSFHLDHVSGDRTNNNRNNLRLICPNCHSQTETYNGKNSNAVSDNDFIKAIEKSISLHEAMIKVGIQPSSSAYKRARKLCP